MYKIYGFNTCNFCSRSKELLDMLSVPYEYHEVPHSLRSAFMDQHGFTGEDRTFPRVWDGDRLVGGYTELEVEVLAR